MIRRLLCKLGFHKYFCKTWFDGKFHHFDNEFECKYCKRQSQKIINNYKNCYKLCYTYIER